MLNPNPVSWKQMQNLDLVFIQMSLFFNFIRTDFIKMSLCCFISFLLWNPGCEIVDCELLKQIVWSFHWPLPIAVRHLESSESSYRAGFMVLRIRIRFQKIWHKQSNGFLNRFQFWSNQTGPRYSVCGAFYRAKNSSDQCKEAGISLLDVERINMI